MGFEEYLNSNLGRFKDELSQKEIKELKGLYDKLYIMKNKANMADNKKVNEQVEEAAQKLAAKIQYYKDRYDIVHFEDISTISM